MSYLERLKAEFSEKALPSELTKPTKAPSVSFVSAQGRHISEIEGANDPLPDPAMEARRQRVLAMLADHPEARYALVTDLESDPEAVLLTLAIRGQATAEFRIPAKKYDPFLLLDLIERHGGTVH
jgi:hypothetical protein